MEDQKLIDAVLNQILKDAQAQDLTAVEELLKTVDPEVLKGFLSEEDSYFDVGQATADSFKSKLHDTAQPDIYYTATDNLPEHVYDNLINGDLVFFDERGTSGGGVKLIANGVDIEGDVYDLEYTVDYCQDFDNSYPDMDMDQVEEEMMARSMEFLSDGLHQDVYLKHVS